MTFWNSGNEHPKKFWDWFARNNYKYLFLHDMEESEKIKAMHELLLELHTYSEHLFFEIGDHADNKDVELVITAEGVARHFGKVEALIDAAPVIPQWRFFKFRQPLGKGLTAGYGNRVFDPKEIVFLPLSITGKPDAVAIRVCYPDYTDEEKSTFVKGTQIALHTLIGERSASLDIDYVDVVKTPDDVDENNFPRLADIAEYIKGRKVFKYPGDRFDVIEHTDDNGYLTFITANFAYKNYAFKDLFPWFIRITLPLEECNENGHPTEGEAWALNSFEDYLDSTLKARGITHYIGRTTLYKKRELLYYVGNPEPALTALSEVVNAPDALRRFQFAVENDASWRQVAYFLEKANSKA